MYSAENPERFDPESQESKRARRRLYLAFIAFLLVAALLLTWGLTGLETSGYLGKPLHPAETADYSANLPPTLIPNIGLGIIQEVMYDAQPDAPDLSDRFDDVIIILNSPVPSATLPLFTSTPVKTATPSLPAMSTTIAPTTANTVVSSMSPTWTLLPSPTSSPTYTATLPVIYYPTYTYTFTPKPNPTSTETPGGPTATYTATPIPTPTIGLCNDYPSTGFAAIQDTYLLSNQKDVANGSATHIDVRPTPGVEYRALVQFDLSSIPPGTQVLGATLYLNVQVLGALTVNFFPVLSSWSEATTWNTQPAVSGTAVGSINPSAVCVQALYLNSDMVQLWVDSPGTNFGLMMVGAGGGGKVEFSSREGTLAPILVVTTDP